MFSNRAALATTEPRRVALDCLEAGIRAADPERATREAVAVADDGSALAVGGDEYRLVDYDRVLVLGGGKAATGVVRALVDAFDGPAAEKLADGLVVVPGNDSAVGDRIGPVEVAAGGHPVPTEAGASATTRLLELAADADERTLVLAVVTGGGSALLAAPAGNLSVDDLRGVTRDLLDAGADIADLNAVRKHCSRVKGGGLARAAAPATVVGVVVSDVVGDDLGVVASGPTAPDETTFGDALAVLDRYGVDAPPVREHLERGAAGDEDAPPETPNPGDAVFRRVSNHVIASNRTAVDAAAAAARDRDVRPCVLSTRVRGEARESARTHVAIAEEVAAAGDPVAPPAVLLSGGETTVTVRGDGTGGPNLEFALSAALEVGAVETPASDADEDCAADADYVVDADCAVAAVDTDGRDGSTDAAGAIVDAGTLPDRTTRDEARGALESNDALPALDSVGALLETGSTGTNVNDLRVIVVTSAGEPAGTGREGADAS